MAIDFLEEKSGIDFQPEGDLNIAPGEKPVEQLGTLEGITHVANLPFQWASRNLFSKIERAPGDKFGLTTRELTPEEAEQSFLGFTPEDFNPPPGTEWPDILKPVASVGKTASGIAQFLTSPHGITEMASALTPAKQITLAKWFMDMGAGALRSIPEAWQAYRRKDWQAMSDALVNAGAMTYGAGKLGGEMFKKPPPPPTPNRGLMIEERSRDTPPKYAIDPLGNVVDISELSEAEQRELFRGPKEFVPREEYVKPAEAVPPIIGEAGGIEPRLTPERLNKILAGLAARTQLIPGIERGTIKEPGAETLGKVSFGALAEAEAVPSARQTRVEPVASGVPETLQAALGARTVLDVLSKEKRPEVRQEINNQIRKVIYARNYSQAKTLYESLSAQAETGRQAVPTEEGRGGIQPSGSEEATRQVPLKEEQPTESRGARGGNLSTFGFFDPANYRPAIEFGRELAGKINDFAKWSAEMVTKFGESIRENLDDIWGFIKSGVDEARQGASNKIQSVLDLSGDDFMKFSAREDNRGLTEKAYELAHEVRDATALDQAKEKATEQAKAAKENFMRADAAEKPKLMNDMLSLAGKRQYFDEAAKMVRALERVAKGETVEAVAKDVGVSEKSLKQFSEQKPPAPIEQRGPGGGNLSTFGWLDPAHIKRVLDDLDRMRQGFKTMFNAVENRLQMDQRLDAADNLANIIGQQAGSNVRQGKVTPKQDVAAAAMIAAEFNPRNLPALLRKAVRGGNKEAEEGIRLAMTDWQTIEPIARRGHDLMDYQHAAENARGINTEYHEGYLPGVYDMDLLMGTGRPFVIAGSRGGGIASGFKKGKTYNSPFDAIEDGYTPRSLKLSDLVEHRVRAGQRLINRIEWGDTFRTVTDPTDNRPIITSPVRHARGPGQPGYESVPMGYVPREVIPGVRVAVHEGYAKLFDALTGRSVIEDFEIGGVPVGSLALGTGGAIKHGLLLFDTFHASRIMQKQLFLQGKVSYNKGRTLLEYSDHDLNAAVRDGETTREAADWARANRGTANLLIREGLNVGRVQEALYTQAIRNIPGIGKANKWIFEKLTRGAMMEAGVHEFERVQRANLNWTPEQVARKVSRDLNAYFGNLGRQGIFKSKTMQDLARLALLAPQWVESVVRSEIGGAKQLALDPFINRKLQVGTLGTGMARGLVMYLIATQIGNLITTGLWGNGPKPTWENEDKGHKLDMWVPDFTGKTRGYYISPLSIVAETTHDIMRAARTEPDVLSAVGRVLSNKAAPMWRAGKVLLQGKDWSGQQVNGVWNKAKHAAIDLLPLPIPASAVVKGGQPGSTQRLMMQSAGIKAEPAGSIRSEVIDRARSWGMNNPNAKVAREYDRRSKTTYPESEYKPLRESLVKKNPEQIVKSVKDLLAVDDTLAKKEKHMKQILREFQPFTEKDIKPYATRSREMEIPFVNSLDAAGKKAYIQAIREQIKDYQTLTQAMYGRAMNPPIPAKYRALFTQP